jgi:hypothetical protein
VAVSKYADHLPLYRQEGIFRRHGVALTRQTMCDWMAVCADLLEPIWKLMHRLILQSKVIQTDDTPVTVLDPVVLAPISGPTLGLPGGSRASLHGVPLHRGPQRRGTAADAQGI